MGGVQGNPRRAPPGVEALRIGRITVGLGRPCVVIAEAACEHRGSLRAAKRLAQAARAAGADIVKFQLHLPDVEMLPGSIRFWAGSMDHVLRQVNLSVEDHRRLFRYCAAIGIQYLCTAYCAQGLEILDALGVPAFKIGSGEMTNLPMIRRAGQLSARTGKPVLVSTGMSTMEEIAETVTVLRRQRARFLLLNCTSEYPPNDAHINLGLIATFRRRFGVLVGHSDHSPDGSTVLGAVALGAKVIEKHFTLDRALKGPDHRVSLEPTELRQLIRAIRRLEAALGAEKRVYPEEQLVRDWAHHSVVSLRPIPAGSVLTAEMAGVKRPGRGVPAKYLEAFYGRVAARDIPANVLLAWNDVRGRQGKASHRRPTGPVHVSRPRRHSA